MPWKSPRTCRLIPTSVMSVINAETKVPGSSDEMDEASEACCEKADQTTRAAGREGRGGLSQKTWP